MSSTSAPREVRLARLLQLGGGDDVDVVHARRAREADVGGDTVTSAPRAAASSASAKPMRPELRLPTKRTESIGSRVRRR